MKNGNLKLLALPLFAFGLFSCISTPGYFGYDNPSVRELQRTYSATVIPSKSEQLALAKKCDDKVYLITSGKSEKNNSSGRAVAVSKDGYFLTAYHVVNKGPFYLNDSKLTSAQKQKIKSDGFFLEEASPPQLSGRIVWYNKGADLAVIKFEQNTPQYFNNLRFPAPVDEVVYTSDDQGLIILPNSQEAFNKPEDHAIGNGPYFSAGKVIFSQLFTHGPGVHTIGSTLVARGGMSGGALVTRKGELCGVIAHIGLSQLEQDNEVKLVLRSTARMLPPEVLRSIISKDRAKQGR